MDNNPVMENIEQKTEKNINSVNGMAVGLVVCCIIGVVGLIFGILGFTKANEVTKSLASYGMAVGEEVIVDEEGSNTVDDYIVVTYNGGKDSAEISDGYIYYYASDGNMSIDYSVDADTASIIQYVKDQDLKKIDNPTVIDSPTWAIDVTIGGESYSVSGEGEAPAWFNDILTKLNVEKNGYLSRKL